MKTNQLMKRRMGNIDVTQRPKDGFFCASELLKQWNEGNNHKKNVNHYLENSKTKEFIKALINDDDQIRNSEKPINQILIINKSRTNKDGSKEAGAVWMSPLLFIDFAMWINPSFKVKVLKFVYDEMIKYRNEAGEEKKQRELYELERKVADLINEGFIKSYDQMITYLKNVYRHKYLPAVFS